MEKAKKIEIANEAIPWAEGYIRNKTVAIIAHDHEKPVDHGTGMLLKVGTNFLVITAAHVIKKYEVDKIQLLGVDYPSNIKISPVFKHCKGGDEGEVMDVGYLLLSEENSAFLEHNGKRFLSLSDLEIFPEELMTSMVLIGGFPDVWHTVSEDGLIHSYQPLMYLADQPNQEIDWIKNFQQTSFRLVYPETVHNSLTGKWEDLPNPHGMSGGGVWVSRFKGVPIWTPDSSRLIGINTEWHQTAMLTEANCLYPLMELLAERFPEAREYLTASIEELQERAKREKA